MVENAGKFFKELTSLSDLGCERAQQQINLLLDMAQATLETSAVASWLKRVEKTIASKYKIVSPEDLPVEAPAIIVGEVTKESMFLEIRDKTNSHITIQRPSKPIVSPIPVHLTPLRNFHSIQDLSPAMTQTILRELSQFEISGLERPKHKVQFSGLKYLTSKALDKLQNLISESRIWSLPTQETLQTSNELRTLRAEYGDRLKLLYLRGDEDLAEEETVSLLETWDRFLKIINEQGLPPKIEDIPIETLLFELNDRRQEKFSFKIESATNQKPDISSLCSPIVSNLIKFEIKESEKNFYLTISGPGEDLLKDVIEPLHRDYQLELIA